jgi:KRAB domain-containing zinc finger protein
MKIHTEKEKLTFCSVCNKSFSSQLLEVHMRVHTGERPYKCSECDTTYKWQSGLRKHMMVKHNIAKIYIKNDVPAPS